MLNRLIGLGLSHWVRERIWDLGESGTPNTNSSVSGLSNGQAEDAFTKNGDHFWRCREHKWGEVRSPSGIIKFETPINQGKMQSRALKHGTQE